MTADREARALGAAAAAFVLLLVVAATTRLTGDDPGAAGDPGPVAVPAPGGAAPSSEETRPPAPADPAPPVPSTHAPDGHIFGGNRFLVAYYGTGQTPSLGVLGEAGPDEMHRRLQRAAKPFQRPDSRVTLVYELIVTIADGRPGPDGDYSHDVPREVVQRYVDAARRHGALLLLDIQTGRAPFIDVARRLAWALREPHVGLALDPEWRMAKDEVPGRVIGAVRPQEVNYVSAWLDAFTARQGLPEKLFVLHQFRTDMIPNIERVETRANLAMVQHVDGFGTPGQKLDTYRAVARHDRFHMGFKLFYDEDVDRMSPRDVRRVRPAVRFVSFQ
ncbi:hypothetical protein ABFT23_16265 [Nocardioides sp. C4-1]|uniref:hypothetical protein n=1 Tax=Nocardioides sp. C4-1 TaxID=3151851 RepID=UPI003267B43F